MTIAAFVLSIIATVASVASLAWNIASWVLTGGRASVEISIGGGSRITGQVVTLPAATPLDKVRDTLKQLPIANYEGYFVTVRNKGRTPITVQEIRFNMPGGVAYMTTKGGDWGDQLPKRLEPGEKLTCANEIAYVQVTALAARNKTGKSVAKVRAVAVLGTGKSVQSRHTLQLTSEDLPKEAPVT